MGKKVKSLWNEEWVQIDPDRITKTKNYFFSNYGRLKSVDKKTGAENTVKGGKFRNKYNVISIRFRDGSSKTHFVQKLVAEQFCEKASETEENFIVHLDGDPTNNHFINLKFVTREGLTENFRQKGVWDPQKKKRNAAYKMTPAKVKMLKRMLKEGKTKKRIIAKQFGITPEQLRKIEKGIDWAWVSSEEEEQQS